MSTFQLKAKVNDHESTVVFVSADGDEPSCRKIAVAMLRILADNLEANHDSDWWNDGFEARSPK